MGQESRSVFSSARERQGCVAHTVGSAAWQAAAKCSCKRFVRRRVGEIKEMGGTKKFWLLSEYLWWVVANSHSTKL